MHILCDVRPASILCNLYLNGLNGKVSGLCHIFNRDRYLCGVIVPPCRCADRDFHVGTYILTKGIILLADLTFLIAACLCAFAITDTHRLRQIIAGHRRTFRLCFTLILCGFCFPGIFSGAFLQNIHILCMDIYRISAVCHKCPNRHTE